jgi:small nuclear ribonucleoprotein D2
MDNPLHPFPSSVDKPRNEMTDDELRKHEQDEFAQGPMRLLTEATTIGAPILIHLRNDHRLVAKVRAFDRHCNMVLESVKEYWREGGGGRGRGTKRRKGVERERHVSKMFLRGDSVILVVQPNVSM